MADLRIVDAPDLPLEELTEEVKIPTGGKGNYAVKAGDVATFVEQSKDLANKTFVNSSSNGVKALLEAHTTNVSNPHGVTKAQIGLSNVDNTADLDKPVGNATQAAIITSTQGKADKTYVDTQDALKANKVDLGTASEYDFEDLPVSNAQKEINDKNVNTVESIADLIAIQNPKDGQVVFVKGYYKAKNLALANPYKGGGNFIYDSTKLSQNDGLAVHKGWCRQFSSYVTPHMIGCVENDSNFDSSVKFAQLIQFATDLSLPIDGIGDEFYMGKVKILSNTHIRNIVIKDNLYTYADPHGVFENLLTSFDDVLTNIVFEDVEFDGQRHLHTGIPYWGYSDNGTHSAVRIKGRVDGLTFKDCHIHHQAGDAVTLWSAADFAPSQPYADSRYSNKKGYTHRVVFDNCLIEWNRRHGVTFGDFDGVSFKDTRILKNGLPLPDFNEAVDGKGSGKDGANQSYDGIGYFGAGILTEPTYSAYYSNFSVDNCTVIDNAAYDIAFIRAQLLGASCRNFSFDCLTAGSINFSGYDFTVNSESDLDAGILHKNATILNSNLKKLIAKWSHIDYLNLNPDVLIESQSSIVTNIKDQLSQLNLNKATVPDFTSWSEPLELKSGGMISSSATNIYQGITNLGNGKSGINLSALALRGSMQGSAYIAVATDRHLATINWSNGSGSYDAAELYNNKSDVLPANSTLKIGSATNYFQTAHLASAPVIVSDRRLKKNIEPVEDVEKKLALRLKSMIIKYRLINSDNQIQMGVIAQDIVGEFDAFGLDAFSYSLIYYDGDADRYGVRYEQLFLFILAAI